MTLVGEVDVKLWVPAVVALAQVIMLNKAVFEPGRDFATLSRFLV